MEEQTVSKPRPVANARARRFRAGAVIVVAVAAGVALWLALRDNGESTSTASGATAMTAAEIENLAASLQHPIFWVGPRANTTYEVKRLENGTVYIRYLPSGASVGSSDPYLTVATYPFPGAYNAIKNLKGKDVVFLKIPKGGIAEYSKKYQLSVHAAYPGVDYQVEVYDPAAGAATGLLVSGELTAFGSVKPTTPAETKPVSATGADLKALVRELGHPVYWVGPKRGFTYELTRTPSGKVYIRYLPAGVKVGSPKPYLSIGTYPFQGAYAATKALIKQGDNQRVTIPDGGVAVLSKSYPQSIHLAYPGSDYQVEIYDPSAPNVREMVSTGQVRAIG